MTEILTTVAYVSGGIALGLLVEVPFYNAVSATREKYNHIIRRGRLY